jgi:hypothetical protein
MFAVGKITMVIFCCRLVGVSGTVIPRARVVRSDTSTTLGPLPITIALVLGAVTTSQVRRWIAGFPLCHFVLVHSMIFVSEARYQFGSGELP